MVNAWADMYSAGYSRQLGGDMAVNLDGIYTKSNAFNAAVPINSPLQSSPGVAATPRVVPYPAWGNITQVQSIGWQKYEALLVRVEKRLSHRYQYTASYTLAKVTDNSFGGTSTGTITDYYNQQWDAGYGGADRRHAAVFSGAYQAKGNVIIGAVWTLRTSAAFSARAGKDLNGDGATSDYVPGTTKGEGNRDNASMMVAVNAYRALNGLGPITLVNNNNNYNRVDVRASKAISLSSNRRLELIAQVFNLFGRNNLGGIGSSFVTNALSNTFGQLTTAQPRQQMELAARFVF